MLLHARKRTRFARRIPQAFIGHCLISFIAAVAGITSSNAAERTSFSDAVPTISLSVPFDDLNLNRYEGAAAMYDRLDHAAKRVCATQRGTTLREQQQYAGCVQRAMQASIAELDRPVLSRYAQEHDGKSGLPRVVRR
jgi:UrcA family protein